MPKKRNAAQIGSVSGKAALNALVYLLFIVKTCTILRLLLQPAYYSNYVGNILQRLHLIVNAWEQSHCCYGQ